MNGISISYNSDLGTLFENIHSVISLGKEGIINSHHLHHHQPDLTCA